jgi:hypothetical protein
MEKLIGYLPPNLFTVVLRHPDTVDAIIEGATLNDITAIALGASPVRQVFVCPAQYLDQFRHGQEIIDRARGFVLCTARVGGFDVEAIGTIPNEAWADEIIRGLDYTKRQERKQRAAERVAAAAALASGPKTKDTAFEADRARERARGVVLDHSRDRHLFELEQRAHLAGA